MENLTIDQVSKEVRNAISKIGTTTLLKKYHNGDFEGQQLIAAEFYLVKREAIKLEDLQSSKTTKTTTTFGKHRSEMTPQELQQAEERLEKTKAANKQKAAYSIEDQTTKPSVVVELTKGKSSKKAEVKEVVEKQPAQPIMKLTKQESILFELIKEQCKNDVWVHLFNNPFQSLREYKGILGSLKKKGIISYDNDSHEICVQNTGIQMIKGQLPYKEKTKHEQNFFKKARVTIVIEGKELEKSAYVRMLLRKNNHISCAELNETLTKVGFSKLYHSELQRCKSQLGIVSEKNKD